VLIVGGIRSFILSRRFASSNDWIRWPGSKPESAIRKYTIYK
jgi:hypothetical protein